VVSIFVPGSQEQEPYLKFWCDFETAGDGYPAKSVIPSSLETACGLLGLPDEAWKPLAAACAE
jgi:hypothetical protein